jgi:Short C-terminal domain
MARRTDPSTAQEEMDYVALECRVRPADWQQDGGPAMMRRRPLRRAAVVGGVAAVAHHAGTRSGEAQAQAAQQEQYAPPSAAPAAPDVGSDEMVAQLQNLKKLLDEGVLTQAEFDSQKQKLLSGS